MNYHLIETYSDAAMVDIAGQQFPEACLVEDDDGIRYAIFPTLGRIPVRWWVAASTAGVSLLLAPLPDGWVYMTSEMFMEERTETAGGNEFLCTGGRARLGAEPPTYRSILAMPTDAPSSSVEPVIPTISSFVHLHAHSEYSPLDGLSKVSEMVGAAVADGQEAMGLTDHGLCAGHPDLQAQCKKAGIRPVFGMEAYLVDDRFRRGTPKPKAAEFDNEQAYRDAITLWEIESKQARDYYHLILWAMNDAGLRNLWGAATEANRDGFFYHPRMDWSTLERYSEGVMASTACLRGPLAHPIIRDLDDDKARLNLGRLMNIFPDRLYTELGTNGLPEQKMANEIMVGLANSAGVPLIAAADSHYACTTDKRYHQIWIAAQTNKDIQDEADLFAGDSDYHVMTASEVYQHLSYLGDNVALEAMANTGAVASRCDAKFEGKTSMPVFSKVGGEQRDVERLVDMALEAWSTRLAGQKKHPMSEYEERFAKEMNLLIDKHYCGYFLQVADYCRHAKKNRVLVGPGRGSGTGSLVAYLIGITEVDPVETGLLFERFLTPGRTSPPDFDVDFPASKRDFMTEYVQERWGEDCVVRVGTHIRLKNKGVVADLVRVLGSTIDNMHYPDFREVAKIIERAEADKAGLGMPWEDLLVQEEELLLPYIQKYPQVFEAAEHLVGRLKSYGKHAAGLVISTDGPLTNRLPMRMTGEDGKRQMVADFAMQALEDLGLLKFDLLTLRTLDTLQECIDLIEQRHGVWVDVYSWTDQYADPEVWEAVCEGQTKGIFQIETPDGTRMVKQFQPRSVQDLADVITLVRPGPKRSGLTDTYLRRKAGLEEVTYPDPRLEAVLKDSYGCIIYQEQVMSTCQILAGYTLAEADEIRSILGKKKVEKVLAAGKEFVDRCVEHGMERDAAQALWDQLGEFARYSFNKSHAYAYAVIGFWTAWFKFHYKVEFLTAVLSTVDQDRIPDFIIEARRMGFKVLPPDVNESGAGFKVASQGLVVRYGLEGIKGVGPKAVEAIVAGQPYTTYEDFLTRRGSACNSGAINLLAQVGALDALVPDRRRLLVQLEWVNSGEADRCQHKDTTVVAPHGLPCTFDWSSEPVILGKKGQPLKQKALPKKCTKACRHYTAPTLTLTDIEPFTPEDIRQIEMELLGVHLSSTPFDRIPPDELAQCATATDINSGEAGMYQPVAALVTKVRPYTAKNGREMGFIGLMAQDGELDVTVFSDEWRKWRQDLKRDALCLCAIRKNDRGLNLAYYLPC